MPEHMNDRPRVFHLITRLLRGGAEQKTLTAIRELRDDYDFVLGHGAEYESAQLRKLDQ